MSQNRLYQRNPVISITSEWSGSEEDASFSVSVPQANQSFFVSSSDIVAQLSHLDNWMSEPEIVETFLTNLDISDEEARTLFQSLEKKRFIISQDEQLNAETTIDTWKQKGWSDALQFHCHIRDYPHADEVVDESEYDDPVELDRTTMEKYRQEKPAPNRYKTYPDAEEIELPDLSNIPEVRFEDAISGLDTQTDSLDTESLTSILYFALAETGDRTFPSQGTFLLKAVPSEGARHPTEGYVAVFDVDGIEPGLYHYSVKEHSLERIRDVDSPEKYAYTDEERTPSAMIIYTSVVEREMWRYREPLIYRMVINDLGHVTEAIEMSARANGRSATTGTDVESTRWEDALGLDHENEPVLARTMLY